MKENTRYVYEGTGNEYASYNVMVDYVNESKVQQRIDNGGTVMANIVEIADGKLTRSYSRGEAYYRENNSCKNIIKIQGIPCIHD